MPTSREIGLGMQPPRPVGPQLPSIRTLHPYLPPGPEAGPSTSTSAQGPAPQSQGGYYPSGSDGDERDDHEPPKKRRRQALSCTECKRRKIRCDRTQPCAPCVKRGDQSKCQWHVVEPASALPRSTSFSFSAEKYFPRGEDDALRARVDALEGWIYHLPPQILASMPPPPGSRHPGPPHFSLSPDQGQSFSPMTHQAAPPPPMQIRPFAGGGAGQGAPYAHPQHQPTIAPQVQTQTQKIETLRALRRSASFSTTVQQGRRSSFSLLHSQSIPSIMPSASSVTQRERSGSYHGHVPEHAFRQWQTPPPPQQQQQQGTRTISPTEARRAISSSPVHTRPPSLSASHPGPGAQWGEGLRASTSPSPAVPGAGSAAGGSGSGRDAAALGNAPGPSTGTGGSFSSFPSHPPAHPASTSMDSPGTFSRADPPPPHTHAHTQPQPSPPFSPFSSASTTGRGSFSSHSSAAPSATYSYLPGPGPVGSDLEAQRMGREVEMGAGMLFQPLHAHARRASEGAVPLARIVGPDVGIGLDDVSLKRAREVEVDTAAAPPGYVPADAPMHGGGPRAMYEPHESRGREGDSGGAPPKNRPAQALQGARLRVSRAPWFLRPPHRLSRPHRSLSGLHAPSHLRARRTARSHRIRPLLRHAVVEGEVLSVRVAACLPTACTPSRRLRFPHMVIQRHRQGTCKAVCLRPRARRSRRRSATTRIRARKAAGESDAASARRSQAHRRSRPFSSCVKMIIPVHRRVHVYRAVNARRKNRSFQGLGKVRKHHLLDQGWPDWDRRSIYPISFTFHFSPSLSSIKS
ncbi:hypothetical protein C8R47DRAFT_263255 [Mycena vitilis]|nr:hypothetical protein C8R47DRAFT_263255 [Mycena vitilis]